MTTRHSAVAAGRPAASGYALRDWLTGSRLTPLAGTRSKIRARPPDNAAQGLAAAWRRGRLALGLGQSAAAQGFFEEAVKHLTQQGHEDNPNLAQARLMLADALAAQGHLSKAAALQADARRALRAQSAGPHHQVTRPPRQPSMPDEPVLRISHHPITPPRTP